MQKDQPPFQIFGDELPALLETLRFSGGLDSRRVEGALAEDILGQYNDRSVLLASATLDAGGFVVLNADLTASNLPMSPLYVPFLGELVQKLLGQGRRAGEIACGEPFALTLPPDATAAAELTIAGPGTGADRSRGTSPTTEPACCGKGPPPGRREFIACCTRTRRSLPSRRRFRRPKATCDQCRQKCSKSVSPEDATCGFDRRPRIGAEEHDTVWSWLAVACVACLLGEVAALKGFKT